jgi:hypothetical protein
MAKKRPTNPLGLVIYLLRLLLEKHFGPRWIRMLAAVMLGLLLALQVMCNGLS